MFGIVLQSNNIGAKGVRDVLTKTRNDPKPPKISCNLQPALEHNAFGIQQNINRFFMIAISPKTKGELNVGFMPLDNRFDDFGGFWVAVAGFGSFTGATFLWSGFPLEMKDIQAR